MQRNGNKCIDDRVGSEGWQEGLWTGVIFPHHPGRETSFSPWERPDTKRHGHYGPGDGHPEVGFVQVWSCVDRGNRNGGTRDSLEGHNVGPRVRPVWSRKGKDRRGGLNCSRGVGVTVLFGFSTRPEVLVVGGSRGLSNVWVRRRGRQVGSGGPGVLRMGVWTVTALNLLCSCVAPDGGGPRATEFRKTTTGAEGPVTKISTVSEWCHGETDPSPKGVEGSHV